MIWHNPTCSRFCIALIHEQQSIVYTNAFYKEIQIDDVFTCDLFNQLISTPRSYINQLVPAYTDWLFNPKERAFVLDALLPVERSVCPILICPDDGNLDCATIAVEIIQAHDRILWKQAGFGGGYEYGHISTFGSNVEWLIPQLNWSFASDAYKQIVAEIRQIASSYED